VLRSAAEPWSPAKGAGPTTRPSDDFDTSLLRRFIVWLVAIKIAGMVLVFDPAGLDVFNLPKSLWSRGTEWLVLALLCVALLRYGRTIIPSTRLHLFVAAFVAASALSTIFAENKYIALFGERDQYLGLAFVFDMFLLYWAVAITFRRVSDWLLLGAVVALSGVTSVGYATLQHAGLDPIIWEDPTYSADHPSSTFGSPDIFSQFLSAMFGAAIGVAVFAKGRGAIPLRVIAIFLATASVFAVGLVAARGSLLGFGAVLVVATLSYLRLRGMGSHSLLRAGVLGVGTLSLLVVLTAASPLGQRAAETAAGIGIRDRLFFYASAVEAFGDHAILGYGPDSFGIAYPAHRIPGVTAVTGTASETSAHSWPLQTAITLGVVGLGSFVALLVAFAAVLWRRGLASSPAIAASAALATAGYLGHGLVNISAVSVDWVPWVAFGTAAAITTTPRVVRRRDLLRHAVAFAALLVVAITGGLTGTSALLANEDALIAKLQWREGLSAGATVAAVSSVQRDPGRADYWNWLGLALEQQKLWRFAGDAFAEAAERAPHSAAYWSNLARARAWQALEGDNTVANTSAALEAARRAATADPNSPDPNAVLAEVAYTFGQYDLALEAAGRAIRLYPDGDHDDLAVAAALSHPDAAEARRELETIVAVRDTASLHLGLAQLSLTLNDLAAARAHAERVLQLKPDSSQARKVISDATR
jgi:tetratricopeptide (TPR) repeat protein/O-antigen ligase